MRAVRAGVKIGQKAVFDMRHRLKPELSDMVCCMNLLAPVLAIFYMSFDRASGAESSDKDLDTL